MKYACLWLFALLVIFFNRGASAQDWPTRTMRVIVPFSAGSGTDVVTRIIMEQLSLQLGQPIVVENRVGAGGTIGANAVAKASSDGYTLLSASSAYTSAPFLHKTLPYSMNDLAAVTPLAILPQVLLISPSQGIKTVQSLVAAGKARAGKMSYASGGAGSATHFSALKLLLSAGFEATHIPFKGGPEALTEVMSGRVDFNFVPALPALSLVRDGRILALAVGSKRRASVPPDIVTLAEAGYPDVEAVTWGGLLVPANTARSIIDKLQQETQKAIEIPAVKAKLANLGADPMPMNSFEFDAYLKAELALNAKLVKAAGIVAEN